MHIHIVFAYCGRLVDYYVSACSTTTVSSSNPVKPTSTLHVISSTSSVMSLTLTQSVTPSISSTVSVNHSICEFYIIWMLYSKNIKNCIMPSVLAFCCGKVIVHYVCVDTCF